MKKSLSNKLISLIVVLALLLSLFSGVTLTPKSAFAETDAKIKVNLVLMMGQSNSGVAYGTGATSASGHAYYFGYNEDTLTNIGSTGGIHSAYAEEWYQQTGETTVYLWSTSATTKDGYPIDTWVEDNNGTYSNNTYLDNTISYLKRAQSYFNDNAEYEVVRTGMLWYQGESELYGGSSSASGEESTRKSVEEYEEMFKHMFDALKAVGTETYDDNLEVSYAGIFRVRTRDYKDSSNTQIILDLRESSLAHYNLANENSDIFMASTVIENLTDEGTENGAGTIDISNYKTIKGDGDVSYTNLLNGSHYTSTGYNLIGADGAYNMAKSLGVISESATTASVAYQTANGKASDVKEISDEMTLEVSDDFMFVIPTGTESGTISVAFSDDNNNNIDLSLDSREYLLVCDGSSSYLGTGTHTFTSNDPNHIDGLFSVDKLEACTNPKAEITFIDSKGVETVYTVNLKYVEPTDGGDTGTVDPDAGNQGDNDQDDKVYSNIYYYWDFTDIESYSAVDDDSISLNQGVTISSQDGNGLLINLREVNEDSLTYSSEGLTVSDAKSAVKTSHFQISKKEDGNWTESITTTLSGGFKMEWRVAFDDSHYVNTSSQSAGIFFGSKTDTKSGHPYIFRNNSSALSIDGTTSTNADIQIPNAGEFVTYVVEYKDYNTFDVTSIVENNGETTTSSDEVVYGSAADNRFTWNYLFPTFNSEKYNFSGTISYLKIWTDMTPLTDDDVIEALPAMGIDGMSFDIATAEFSGKETSMYYRITETTDYENGLNYGEWVSIYEDVAEYVGLEAGKSYTMEVYSMGDNLVFKDSDTVVYEFTKQAESTVTVVDGQVYGITENDEYKEITATSWTAYQSGTTIEDGRHFVRKAGTDSAIPSYSTYITVSNSGIEDYYYWDFTNEDAYYMGTENISKIYAEYNSKQAEWIQEKDALVVSAVGQYSIKYDETAGLVKQYKTDDTYFTLEDSIKLNEAEGFRIQFSASASVAGAILGDLVEQDYYCLTSSGMKLVGREYTDAISNKASTDNNSQVVYDIVCQNGIMFIYSTQDDATTYVKVDSEIFDFDINTLFPAYASNAEWVGAISYLKVWDNLEKETIPTASFDLETKTFSGLDAEMCYEIAIANAATYTQYQADEKAEIWISDEVAVDDNIKIIKNATTFDDSNYGVDCDILLNSDAQSLTVTGTPSYVVTFKSYDGTETTVGYLIEDGSIKVGDGFSTVVSDLSAYEPVSTIVEGYSYAWEDYEIDKTSPKSFTVKEIQTVNLFNASLDDSEISVKETPTILVKDAVTEEAIDTADYTISWTLNGNAVSTFTEGGTYTAKVAGVGNYKYATEHTLELTVLDVYTITYSNTKEANNSNPTTYTVKTESVDLADLTNEYYNFVEWQVDGSVVTSIGGGKTGDMNITAVWEAKAITVTLDVDNVGYNGTALSENPTFTVVVTGTEDVVDSDAYDAVWTYADGAESTFTNAGTYTLTVTLKDTTISNTATYAIEKATYTGAVNQTNLTATYGDLLSSVTLPAGYAYADSYGADVTVGNVNASGNTFNITYTDASGNYETVTGLTATIVVSKATYTGAESQTDLTATYGAALSSVTLPAGYAYAGSYGTDTTVGNVNASGNTFDITYTDVSGNYETVTGLTATIVVSKATYTGAESQTDLTATYGDLLSSVTLPAGYAYAESYNANTTVGDANTSGNTFDITYTDASGNYETVTGLTATIVVSKAAYTGAVNQSNLTATYGDLLSSVTLPAGYAYVDSYGADVTVGDANASGNTFDITYTDASGNYETVTGLTATIVVSKATPTETAPADINVFVGTKLSEIDLNIANTTVAGEFQFTDEETTLSVVGTQELGIVFVPTDGDNYNSQTGLTVNIVVVDEPVINLPEVEDGQEPVFGEEIRGIENASKEIGQSLAVTLAEVESPDETSDDVIAIKDLATGGNADFYNFEIEGDGDTVSDTVAVIEIAVNFDFSKTSNVEIYRYHEGQAVMFEELDAHPEIVDFQDAKYFADKEEGVIYIYSRYFSTYAITYDRSSSSTGVTLSSKYTVGGSSSSDVEEPTETPEPEVPVETEKPVEPTVTPAPTVAPTPTPAPAPAESGSGAWIWIILGVLVIGGVAGYVVYKKKQK